MRPAITIPAAYDPAGSPFGSGTVYSDALPGEQVIPVVIGRARVRPSIFYARSSDVGGFVSNGTNFGYSGTNDVGTESIVSDRDGYTANGAGLDSVLAICQAGATIQGVWRESEFVGLRWNGTAWAAVSDTSVLSAIRRLQVATTSDATYTSYDGHGLIFHPGTVSIVHGHEIITGASSPWGKRWTGWPDTYSDITGSTLPAWAYLVGSTAEGMSFAGLTHLRCERLLLKSNGKLPSIEFLVDGVGGGADCRPDTAIRYVLVTMLGIPDAQVVTGIGPDGQTASSFAAWCNSMPDLRFNGTIAGTPLEVLDSLLQASHAELTFSGGALKVFPLGDMPVGSYVPSQWSTLLSAWQPIVLDRNEVDANLIQCTIVEDAEVCNVWPVSYKDQAKDFKDALAYWIDDWHAAQYGRHLAQTTDNPWVSTSKAASLLSQFLAQASINRRRRFNFRVSARWVALEPGDLVTIGDGTFNSGTGGFDNTIGIPPTIIRLTGVNEAEDGSFDCEGWEWIQGASHPIDLTPDQPPPPVAIAPPLTPSDSFIWGQIGTQKGLALDASRISSVESWDHFNIADWEVLDSSGTLTVESGGYAGGKVLRCTGGAGWTRIVKRTLIPYDPSRLYQVRVRARETAGSGGYGVIAGFVGVASDGVTLVNMTGANDSFNQHYIYGGTSGSWSEAIGYWKGTATPGGDGGTLAAPGPVNTGARYVRLLLYFDGAVGRTLEVDTLELVVADPVAEAAQSTAADAYATAQTAAADAANRALPSLSNVTPGAVSLALLAAGQGLNLCPNGDFSAWDSDVGRPEGWTGVGNLTPAASGANEPSGSWSLLGNVDPMNRQWLNTPYMNQAGPVGSDPDTHYYEWLSSRIPVEVGKRYAASAYTGAHRCKVEVFIYWCNATDEIAASQGGAVGVNDEEKTGGNALDGYKRCYATGVAPTGAVAARVSVRKYDTKPGQTSSYLFACRAALEEIPPNATTPGPWTPPATNIVSTHVLLANAVRAGNIAANAVTARELNVASLSAISADLGTVTAGVLRTTTYAEDGSGNPTTGAKFDSTGTVLKVAPGNLQIGNSVLSALTQVTDGTIGSWWQPVGGVGGIRVARSFNTVSVNVRLQASNASASWASIGTLPVGMRPPIQVQSVGLVSDDSASTTFMLQVQIGTDGSIKATGYDNGTSVVSMFAIGSSDSVNVNFSFVL